MRDSQFNDIEEDQNIQHVDFLKYGIPFGPSLGSEVGVRDDGGKLPYHLLPPELMEGVARILQFGAKKYSPRNWEKGMDWSRVFSSMNRHIWAWWNGEDNDPETGLSHLDHIACNIAFLQAYRNRKVGKDDRPSKH